MPYDKNKIKEKDEAVLEDMQAEIDTAEMEDQVGTEDFQEKEDKVAGSETLENDAALEAAAKISEQEDRIKRLQADFDNFRRRTRQEKEELSAVVAQGILKDMLPLLDNFERALAAEKTDGEAFQQGVEMIYKQLHEVLLKNGLEVIDTKDKKFDPNFHQAVMRVQNDDLADDMIAAEMQKGYTVKGHVIRPSMVQVVAN